MLWGFKKPLKNCYSWSSGFPSGPGLQDVGSRQSQKWRQTGPSPRKIITCEPRKKRKRPYFPLCWLFKRDPYILVYYNPHIPVEYNPLHTLNLRVFSSLLRWKSFHKNPWNYHHTLSLSKGPSTRTYRLHNSRVRRPHTIQHSHQACKVHNRCCWSRSSRLFLHHAVQHHFVRRLRVQNFLHVVTQNRWGKGLGEGV